MFLPSPNTDQCCCNFAIALAGAVYRVKMDEIVLVAIFHLFFLLPLRHKIAGITYPLL